MQQIPLDRAAMKAVRAALAELDNIEPLLIAAEKAGFNTGEERARFEFFKGLASQILATYEPIVFKQRPVDS